MINIEEIKKATPKESLLCELIETELMGVIIDECCTEDQMGMVINAVYLYKRACGENIRVFAVGDHNDTPYIRMLMKGYAVTDNIEFVRISEADSLLTRFLGSEALITSDKESDCSRLAKDFYVPRLCLSDCKDFLLSDGVLYIGSEPSSVSAGLMVIRERKYSDELSGHKRLV
ncbi:MAG: hypothetical protein ACI4J0_11925 [Huintestinicola sp.]|uniref:hypothetical protein n=1 Tax=Huintestinicola sp. TaxID=2981661 RepID=UPI003F0A541C